MLNHRVQPECTVLEDFIKGMLPMPKVIQSCGWIVLVLGFFAHPTDGLGQDPLKRVADRSGIEKVYFSPSVGPGNDFFRYVNDQWLEKTEIPADQSN
jgi:hypothetical protein